MGKKEGKKKFNLMALGRRLIPGVTGLITLLTASPSPGSPSVLEALRTKNYEKAGRRVIASMSGFKLNPSGPPSFDLMATLNPIDLQHAPTPKAIMLTEMAMSGISHVGSFVKSLFSEVLSI